MMPRISTNVRDEMLLCLIGFISDISAYRLILERS